MAKKPRVSLTTIGVFLMARTKSSATARALSPVFSPRITSVSIIRSTGEKKWMPMKRSWSSKASARLVIGMVEVLEA